jgi:hypothetical protein
MLTRDLPWQDLIAGLMGLAALVHVAKRWWPKGKGAASSGCGSCDNGCGSTDTGNRQVCDHSQPTLPSGMQRFHDDKPHRVIPITQESPKH